MQKDRYTGRQTHGYADRWTDRELDRQTDRDRIGRFIDR